VIRSFHKMVNLCCIGRKLSLDTALYLVHAQNPDKK